MKRDYRFSYDVFLSYNSADETAVKCIAARLQDDERLSPFLDCWDLPAGRKWQEGIEQALDQSAAFAVLLGPNGLGEWQNEEMRAALEERRHSTTFPVIPVLLPGSAPRGRDDLPRFLRRYTWVDFRSGLDDSEAFRQLAAALRGEAPGRQFFEPAGDSGLKSGLTRYLAAVFKGSFAPVLLALPVLLVILLAAALKGRHVPTRVVLNVTVSRVLFTVAGANWTRVIDSTPFESVTIEKFASVRFRPTHLEVADPSAYDLDGNRYPASAWQPVSMSAAPVVIRREGDRLHSLVTFDPGPRGRPGSGVLAGVTARPGSTVTLEVSGSDRVLAVRVDNQKSDLALALPPVFQMQVDSVLFEGLGSMPFRAASLGFRGQLGTDRNVEIAGLPDSFGLVLEAPAASRGDVFPKEAIPVSAVDLTRQGPAGERLTALISRGTIIYPEYPEVKEVTLGPADFLSVDDLRHCRIESIAFDDSGLHLEIRGAAGSIRAGAPGLLKDRRLTLFGVLLYDHGLLILGGVIVWVLAGTAGAYRLLRTNRI